MSPIRYQKSAEVCQDGGTPKPVRGIVASVYAQQPTDFIDVVMHSNH